jgi:hypothetical protein
MIVYASGYSEQNSGCQPNGASGVEHGPAGRKISTSCVTDGLRLGFVVCGERDIVLKTAVCFHLTDTSKFFVVHSPF